MTTASNTSSPYFSTPATQFLQLHLLSDAHETVQRGTPDFPCCAYICDFNKVVNGIYPLHWHNELQFTLANQNSLSVMVNDKVVILAPGEGIFINSCVFHSIESVAPGPCKRLDIIFQPNLLYGSSDNVFYQKYVGPLLQSGALCYVKFDSSTDFGKQLLHHFHVGFTSCREQNFGFELNVRNALSSILLLICEQFAAQIHTYSKLQCVQEQRVRIMVDYIYKNYQNSLTLGEIAASASISERECSRCFQQILNMSPFTFLNRHRIVTAQTLLDDGSNSISDICFLCGFNTPSYFIKTFRKFMHCTPTEYRQLLSTAK